MILKNKKLNREIEIDFSFFREEYADVTAHDFVTGLQHAADFKSGTSMLMRGVIKNYVEYENGNINILVSKKDATSKDAENIISLIYGEGITNKTPIVSFKG